MAYEGGYTSAMNSLGNQNEQVSHQQSAAMLNAMRQMAMQAEMRQQQARGPGFDQLQALFGGKPPMVPPPPGTVGGGPQPMPPGTASPAPPQATPQAPPGGGIPPPPMGAAPAAPAAPAMPPAAMAPPPIPPFRPLPAAPPQAGPPGPPAGIPPPPPDQPPPAAAPVADAGPPGIGQAKLREAIASVSKLPMSSSQKMDVLDQMMPVLNKAEQQELSFYKAQTATLTMTEKFYRDSLRDNWEKEKQRTREQNANTRGEDVESKIATREGNLEARNRTIDARADAGRQKISRQVGGDANIKKWEYDPADPTKVVGGWTKTGRHIKLDEPGVGVSGKSGGGASGQAQTVRASLVAGSATNALRLLDEAEKTDKNTSAFFGTHADNPATKALYGTAKNVTLTQKDRQNDADWAGIIEEVGPVLSGGLRNSDAFRRFLIEQAPGIGDDKETRARKRKILRDNVDGTSKAFFNKFASDPKMWGEGVSKEQVDAAKRGGGSPSAAKSFASEAEAAAAGLQPGTPVIINGVKGKWQ